MIQVTILSDKIEKGDKLHLTELIKSGECIHSRFCTVRCPLHEVCRFARAHYTWEGVCQTRKKEAYKIFVEIFGQEALFDEVL